MANPAATRSGSEVLFRVERVDDGRVAIRRLVAGKETGSIVFDKDGMTKGRWQPLFMLVVPQAAAKPGPGRPSSLYFPLLVLICAERALHDPNEDSWCDLDNLRRIGAASTLERATKNAAKALDSKEPERLILYQRGTGYPNSFERPMATLREGVRAEFIPDLIDDDAATEDHLTDQPWMLARRWLSRHAKWLDLDSERPSDRHTSPTQLATSTTPRSSRHTVPPPATLLGEPRVSDAARDSARSEFLSHAPASNSTSEAVDPTTSADMTGLRSVYSPPGQVLAAVTRRRLDIVNQELARAETEDRWHDAIRLIRKRVDLLSQPRSRADSLSRLGSILSERLGNIGEAKEAFASALESDPLNDAACDFFLSQFVETNDMDGIQALIDNARSTARLESDVDRLVEFARIATERLPSRAICAEVWGAVLCLDPTHSEARAAFGRLYDDVYRASKAERMASIIEWYSNWRSEQVLAAKEYMAGEPDRIDLARTLGKCCMEFRSLEDVDRRIIHGCRSSFYDSRAEEDRDRSRVLGFAMKAWMKVSDSHLLDSESRASVRSLLVDTHRWAGKKTLYRLWKDIVVFVRRHEGWLGLPCLVANILNEDYYGGTVTAGFALRGLRTDRWFCWLLAECLMRAGTSDVPRDRLDALRMEGGRQHDEFKSRFSRSSRVFSGNTYHLREALLLCRMQGRSVLEAIHDYMDLATLYETELEEPIMAFEIRVRLLSVVPSDLQLLAGCRRVSQQLGWAGDVQASELIDPMLDVIRRADPYAPEETLRFLLSHGRIEQARAVISKHSAVPSLRSVADDIERRVGDIAGLLRREAKGPSREAENEAEYSLQGIDVRTI